MKKIILFIFLAVTVVLSSCKEKESDSFKFLTDPVWVAETLLANGVDASGPGGLLSQFVGDAKFEKDGTGYFGSYTGEWRFSNNETKLVITTSSLPLPITADIIELTSTSLKLSTLFLNPQNPTGPAIDIQMTFKRK